jgi:uncharacterized protein DUF5684
MKIQFRWPSHLGLGISLAVFWLSAITAVAQSSDDQTAGAIFSGIFLLLVLGLCLAVYVYWALALGAIAVKTKTPNPWLAWIPIIHLFLVIDIAKKPAWWFVLFLIPLVNIVILILVWMGVARARRKPDWWGILMIVPLANLIVPGYLAWSD